VVGDNDDVAGQIGDLIGLTGDRRRSKVVVGRRGITGQFVLGDKPGSRGSSGSGAT